ncbi:penicillin-insensitive murein endopeptidase [Bacteriovorax sp. DB6_IX]|uniref:penicillin-insensitive murein endopeptidase n=1 Tax=Bacteriovorax sp. DB6_IX TaxID=1353530 RepID=UPI00038A54F5|nr:penicillin-insensitive murein endopeptidase [Bacteriovorax sp. DB6_IX]EQC52336.1 peptidoglycan amidase MepA [Bacteriovorax sp. DB6_IX]
MLKIILGLALISFNSTYASEAIGFYSKGQLKNSEDIYHNSTFIKLFQKRGKNYTTQEMLTELNKLADLTRRMYPNAERLQVGDLSAQNGGKINRHVSHQNGLDADVVYLRHNNYEQSEEAPEWEEYFVKSGKITKNFHKARNWFILDYLVHNTDANRIFVDQAIKSYYCKEMLNKAKYSKEEIARHTATLRVLRPAKYHKTHFHLRLNCPKDDKRCENQVPPPAGSGCNSLNIIDQHVH